MNAPMRSAHLLLDVKPCELCTAARRRSIMERRKTEDSFERRYSTCCVPLSSALVQSCSLPLTAEQMIDILLHQNRILT